MWDNPLCDPLFREFICIEIAALVGAVILTFWFEHQGDYEQCRPDA
jgi:hypothetical protein